MIPKFKPVIIEDIVKDGIVVGNVVAINLKQIDLEDKSELDAYIKSIQKIINFEINDIYIDGQQYISNNSLVYIRKSLNLEESKQIDKTEHLSFMIEKLLDFKVEQTSEKEVLIIANDNETIKDLASKIGNQFRFLSIYGGEELERENICDYILEETGISVFCPLNLESVINNYSVIINFLDLNFQDKIYKKIKKSSIVFDFSGKSNFNNAIHAFGYSLKDFKLNQCNFMNEIVDDYLFCVLRGITCKEVLPKYVCYKKSFYTINSFVSSFKNKKGNF